ncbi:MotA/TolQ/ExbB proton channel family protein [Zooshikella ganghwensis]|uniref:MotA/TolQ/ExbB proton channel family protein n=1 Tax=Zooshikella ganghwensis TaxID=202772 RepID=A0A4V1IN73_9GAMM|nr:MotA/TolQ/ExbB proton channel family protein [Zooshikella ganghwensis]RDH42731.1 MotA/TolQ/ExbB proton channel family protein [Zooshikella ganghwensis]
MEAIGWHIAVFFQQGGWVLWLIAGVCLILWGLIIERFLYFFWQRKLDAQSFLSLGSAFHQQYVGLDKPAYNRLWQWYKAHLLNQYQQLLEQGQRYIKLLVVICPLLGLLGTVTGMIQVFEALMVAGNMRAMANGVASATMPTMAGMVVALSGIYFRALIQQRTRIYLHELADQL